MKLSKIDLSGLGLYLLHSQYEHMVARRVISDRFAIRRATEQTISFNFNKIKRIKVLNHDLRKSK